jgi:hypothetical protein
MAITKEELAKQAAEVGMQPAICDAMSIFSHPENGTFMILVTKKGKTPLESRQIMADDIETVIELVRGIFPKVTVPPPVYRDTPIEDKSPIGFTSGLAKAA